MQNHERTERIYRQEKLSLRIGKRKKLAAQGRGELPSCKDNPCQSD